LARPIALFGHVKCGRLSAAHVGQLQATMKADGCKNSYINLVVGATGRALDHAKAWSRIQEDVRRLTEEPGQIGRAITLRQKKRLFEIAASKEVWTVAYSAALIAANTTMRGCELKALRWKDVNLFERQVSVPDSKTAAGLRRIPLNENAMVGFRRSLAERDRSRQHERTASSFRHVRITM
jgi:integrase